MDVTPSASSETSSSASLSVADEAGTARPDLEHSQVTVSWLRRAGLGGVALLLLPAAMTTTSAQAGCGAVTGPVLPAEAPVLNVSVSAERRSYRNGQLAFLPVAVHVGTPDGPAVAAAELQMTITTGRWERTIGGTTEEDGTARLHLRISGSIPRGTLRATVAAKVVLIGGTDCDPGFVYGVGSGTADPLTTIKD